MHPDLEEVFALLSAFSQQQAGLINRSQAISTGFGRVDWDKEVRLRKLPIIDRAVYVLGDSEGDERRDLHAALLFAGHPAVLSHRSAAKLYELWGIDGFPLELTSPQRLYAGLTAITVHRARLPASDVCEHEGFPVTTLARTLLDLASEVDPVHFAVLMESARRRDTTIVEELLARVETANLSEKVKRNVRRVLADCDARSERPMDSPFEIQFWHRWPFTGLPMPRPQYKVVDGKRVCFIDFAWPEQKVCVETQGYETRQTRESFDYDAERANRLIALGWHVIPVTYTMFKTAFFTGVAPTVANALRARGL